MSRDERLNAQEYLDEMVRQRGYVLEYHKLLVGADPEVAKAANELGEATYLNQRRLDRKVKELLSIVSLGALRAPRAHIQGHIQVALRLGVEPEEILEALELLLPECGVVAFQEALAAWAEAVGAEPLQPTMSVEVTAATPRTAAP